MYLYYFTCILACSNFSHMNNIYWRLKIELLYIYKIAGFSVTKNCNEIGNLYWYKC